MHTPVLLKESIYYLNPRPGDTILDATINGGGHAREILKIIGEKGWLIGIDQDETQILNLKNQISTKNLILINGNFREVDKLMREKLNGAIFDLGMSSNQLEEGGRGFSFQKDEPLLMSYGQGNNLTAGEILNKWSEKDISNVLFKYGEERYSRRIAKNIVKARPVETTFELVDIIRGSVPSSYRAGRINCATRTFQALRIAVNDEINALKEGMEKVWKMISKEGRMVIISFHSLEDREVKNFFRELKNKKRGIILTKKPTIPTKQEKQLNPRSRSAKLRAIEKI